MNNAAITELESLHRRAFRNKGQLELSRDCACFACLEHFAPAEVVDWVDEGQTAVCPRCGVDAVLGDACGVALTGDTLSRVRQHYFGYGFSRHR